MVNQTKKNRKKNMYDDCKKVASVAAESSRKKMSPTMSNSLNRGQKLL